MRKRMEYQVRVGGVLLRPWTQRVAVASFSQLLRGSWTTNRRRQARSGKACNPYTRRCGIFPAQTLGAFGLSLGLGPRQNLVCHIFKLTIAQMPSLSSPPVHHEIIFCVLMRRESVPKYRRVR